MDFKYTLFVIFSPFSTAIFLDQIGIQVKMEGEVPSTSTGSVIEIKGSDDVAHENQKCVLCNNSVHVEKTRRITENNFATLGIATADLEMFNGSQVCTRCWLSRMVKSREKVCPINGCTTPKRKLQRLYALPLGELDAECSQNVLQKFQVAKEDKVCRRCRTNIISYIEREKRQTPLLSPPTIPSTPNVQKSFSSGRPRVRYSEASAATKRRMKASAKNMLSGVIRDCDDISRGEGVQLVQDAMGNTALKKDTSEKENNINVQNIFEGISDTYEKESHGPAGKIRLLSSIAPHFKNKEIKKAIPCTDYELTEARKHAQLYGPGATPPPAEKVKRYRIPPEDLAFVLNFIHHPDNTCRSSHRMASCEGSKSSWISDMFENDQQPVMWLKDGQLHLYKKYREECEKEGRKPISESKFRDGLSAGNFKEMARMTGLCNICDEVGAQNWKKLFELIEMLGKEINGDTTSVEDEQEDEFEDEDIDQTTVTMIDITDQDDKYKQHNPLPVDCPVLMVEVNPHIDQLDNLVKKCKILKGHLLSKFSSELQQHSACPFHCMELLLNEKSSCKNHHEICQECIQRFTLFDDLLATINVSSLNATRKKYYREKFIILQRNLDLYIAHLVRGKHQRTQFMKDIEELKPGHALVVCDYMMKLLLEKFREPQRDWYGKKGVSVHGSMFFFKTKESGEDIMVEIHDVFSNGDCTQNWYFSASAFEATFKNFSARHEDVTSLVIWSDNGPHYHNTSIIFWLSRASELWNMDIVRYSFFEAQKGKTSLDSHFATFKFALKSWMKKGNDLLDSADIVDGTTDNLKGTHVYEIHINRYNEPQSAKTLDGITSFSDFTFVKSPKETHKSVVARELTDTGTTMTIIPKKISKLWPSYIITSSSLSTGVTSEYDQKLSENVKPRYNTTTPKKKKTSGLKETNRGMVQSNANKTKQSSSRCPKCQKFFLRRGCMLKHVASCTDAKESKWKTLDELKTSFPLVQAMGLLNSARALNVRNLISNKDNNETEPNPLWCYLLKGSGKKVKVGKRNRFTEQQKEIMKDCFDVGEKDKRKRFTTQSCQRLMEEKIGKELTLSTRQIASFWSNYKRKKNT